MNTWEAGVLVLPDEGVTDHQCACGLDAGALQDRAKSQGHQPVTGHP